MSRFGYETSPNGKDRFAETVAIKTGQGPLRAKIIAKLSGNDELRQFEYFTQEACDPVILSKISPENWARRIQEREKLVDANLKQEMEKNIMGTKISASILVLEKAWNIQSLRATGVNSQKIDDLDSKYRAWISTNNPDGGIEFYDDCLTWLGYAQQVASSPEFSDYARKKSPTFFNAF